MHIFAPREHAFAQKNARPSVTPLERHPLYIATFPNLKPPWALGAFGHVAARLQNHTKTRKKSSALIHVSARSASRIRRLQIGVITDGKVGPPHARARGKREMWEPV